MAFAIYCVTKKKNTENKQEKSQKNFPFTNVPIEKLNISQEIEFTSASQT